ncbi:MAG: hypothetical protein LBB80_06150 [Treponema sp.]|nr:hypothetical protein [Treponema sp.]
MGVSHETAAPPFGEGLTFEKVWASLMELKESQRETDRQIKAMSAETDRQMRETDKRIGEITNRFGDMVEHMVVPNLVAKFQELDFTFTRVSRDIKIADEQNRVFLEVDAFLENGDKVMIVEIKTKPNTSDINDHVERMKKLRSYADVHHDRQTYLGAVAGVVISDSVKTYAFKNGFYVLEPSGETFTITEPKAQGYTPKEW